MARSPVSRTQVDAYRFGLRRLDAALVSRDPVPLHEELRGQRRAAAAGAVLAMLGLAGAALLGLISPSPDWTQHELVTGRQSGALYAVGHGPDRLVPVANLAAGRLVLAALGNPAPTATPTPVDDADLAGAPRTATAAVAGAPAVLPGAGSGPSRWSVCDTHPARPGAPPLPDTGLPEATTVVAGGPPPDRALGSPDAVLARGRAGGPVYLLTDGTRRRVDLADRRVATAYELGGRTPWAVGTGFLAAVSEAPPLAAPIVPGAGGPPPGGLPGRVGDVVRVGRAGEPARHYVLLTGGVQEVPGPLAALLRRTAPEPIVPAERIATLPKLDVLDLAGQPDGPLRLVEPTAAATVCWHWSAERGEPPARFSLPVDAPVPPGATVTRLAQADGAGPALDAVVVPADVGALRAVVPGQDPGTGALWLLSGSGVAYGVRDGATADALGVGEARPAPQAVLALLPVGPALDLAQVRQTVDG